MDRTAGFVSRWVILDDTERVQASVFYKAYCADTEAQGGKPISNTAFGRIMRKKFAKTENERIIFYLGIRLRDGVFDKPDDRYGPAVDDPFMPDPSPYP
jgi:putative DNA primase/helicase